MATATPSHAADPNLMASRAFAEMFQAYIECSDEIQAVIRDMVAVANDTEGDEVDRTMAIATIAEALFPNRHDGELGMDLVVEQRLSGRRFPDIKNTQAEMDHEETFFADSVQAILDSRGMTQHQLADACGMGQPAVSNLLSRQSRPQRRTVEKIAAALNVDPSTLWPS